MTISTIVTNQPTIDYTLVRQYFDSLGINPDHAVWKAIKDGSDQPPHFYKGMGELDKIVADNKAGFDVYLMANPGSKPSTEGLTGLNVLYLDIDSPETIDQAALAALPPYSFKVSTGKGYHLYWALEGAELKDADRWQNIQTQMIEAVGADPNAKGASRVLRVPGFHYWKGAELPGPISQIEVNSQGEPVSLTKLLTSVERIKAQPKKESTIETNETKALNLYSYAQFLGKQTRDLNLSDLENWAAQLQNGSRNGLMYKAGSDISRFILSGAKPKLKKENIVEAIQKGYLASGGQDWDKDLETFENGVISYLAQKESEREKASAEEQEFLGELDRKYPLHESIRKYFIKKGVRGSNPDPEKRQIVLDIMFESRCALRPRDLTFDFLLPDGTWLAEHPLLKDAGKVKGTHDIPWETIQIVLRKEWGWAPTVNEIQKEAIGHGNMTQNVRDEVREYMESLPLQESVSKAWEKLTDAADYLFTLDPEEFGHDLKRRYLGIFLCHAYARAVSYGCQVDESLTLVGDMGIKKTSFFRALTPIKKYFGPLGDLDVKNKDFLMSISKFHIAMVDERDRYSNKKEAGEIKTLQTGREDVYRPPYASGNANQAYPRKSVFCFTTNHQLFINDVESRRDMVIVLKGNKRMDIKFIDDHLSELYSCAKTIVESAWNGGDPYWIESDLDREMQFRLNSAHVLGDDFGSDVAHLLAAVTKLPDVIGSHEDGTDYYGMTSKQILNILEMPVNKATLNNLTPLMSKYGFERKQATAENGVREWIFIPKDLGSRRRRVMGKEMYVRVAQAYGNASMPSHPHSEF